MKSQLKINQINYYKYEIIILFGNITLETNYKN